MVEESKKAPLNINNLLLGQQPLIPQPEKNLCHRDHIPFAVMDDTFQVLLFIVNISYHAPVNVLLGRGDAKYMGQEF